MQPISVLCPTYGHTTLLAEMVKCFQNLQYDGDRELVILNDLAEQQITVDDPLVRVINVSNRYPTLGDKRNALVELAKYDWLRWWDDDDIFLPHCLSILADKVEGRQCIRETYESEMDADGNITIRNARPMGTMLVHKNAIKAVGGFAAMHMHQDINLNKKLVNAGFLRNIPTIKEMPSTIWRRGLSHFHVTDLGNVQVANAKAVNATLDAAHQRLASGEEPTGAVTLVPALKQDYATLVDTAWRKWLT